MSNSIWVLLSQEKHTLNTFFKKNLRQWSSVNRVLTIPLNFSTVERWRPLRRFNMLESLVWGFEVWGFEHRVLKCVTFTLSWFKIWFSQWYVITKRFIHSLPKLDHHLIIFLGRKSWFVTGLKISTSASMCFSVSAWLLNEPTQVLLLTRHLWSRYTLLTYYLLRF